MRTSILPTPAAMFELAARWFVAAIISIYGIGKFFKMQLAINPEILQTPLGEISGFQLTWAFFGHSYFYVCFIGASQLLGAVLLLHPRTKILGAGLLVPILVNIIIVDIFYGVPKGALFTAIWLLLWVFYILLFNRIQIIAALKILTTSSVSLKAISTNWEAVAARIVLIIGGTIILFFVMNLIVKSLSF